MSNLDKEPEGLGYTFRCVQRDGTTVELRIPYPDNTWTDLLEEFRQFLNGCGFSMPAGEWWSNEEMEENRKILEGEYDDE